MCCGRAQSIGVSTTPGQVVLDCIRKKADGAMGSKAVSSIPPFFYMFVPLFLSMMAAADRPQLGPPSAGKRGSNGYS